LEAAASVKFGFLLGGIVKNYPAQIFNEVMSSFLKNLIAGCIFLVLAGSAASNDALPSGVVEGHLRIFSLKEVELADGNAPTKTTAENYADYPLIILNRDGKQEIARVNADTSGNYRLELPPGDYVLDVRRGANGRPLGHLRAKPQAFTIVSSQTVRVDMNIDTGIR
jgi:hypothetical protein